MSAVASTRVERAAAPLPGTVVADVALRVLTLTTLYPSAANPRHGIFVETRLRKLREQARIDLRVVAPVPWFPFNWRIAGRYATFAATPRRELRDDVDVRHPRFVSIPRVGMAMQPQSLAAASLRAATGKPIATSCSPVRRCRKIAVAAPMMRARLTPD